MVEWLAAGAASATMGAHSAFKYNRENFKYDREMRQKTEFQVLDFRAKQASMWRQDVSDVIELTEKKMESYLIVNTIQLGMVLVLFTEGRLEAGTPQWLLRFYMINLGSAFMYLLLSVWLAMHASIVAQTSGTRLLTQFVRLPIPTWQHIDKMRTYGSSFENMGKNMVRIPFLSGAPQAPKSTWNKSGSGAWASRSCATPHPAEQEENSAGKMSLGTSTSASSSKGDLGKSQLPSQSSRLRTEADVNDDGHFDVWGLEDHGQDIGELKEADLEARPHIKMLKQEAIHWQCNDMFSRVAMSFGTNHVIYAIIYYCFGYISVQDGAPMPAWCVAAVMMSVSIVLVTLDFKCTTRQLRRAMVLLLTGPCCMGLVCFLLAKRSPHFEVASQILLPIGYIGHAGWLLWALKALEIKRHDWNGAWIPMGFRAVAFLDVFGWYDEHKHEEGRTDKPSYQLHNPYLVRQSTANLAKIAAVRRPDLKVGLGPCGKVDYYSPTNKQAAALKASAQARGLRLPLQSRTASSDSEPPTPQAIESMKDRLQGDFALWQNEDVQSMMDAHDQDRISRLQREFNTAVGQHTDASHPASASASGAKPIFEGSAPDCCSPAAAGLGTGTSSGSNGQASWVQLKGHTDMGAEMKYVYNADSGEVRSMSFSQEDIHTPLKFSSELRRSPLSLSTTEENVKQFCRKAASVKAREPPPTVKEEEVAHHKVDDASSSAFAGFLFEEHGEEPHGGCCTGPAFPKKAAADHSSGSADSSDPPATHRVFLGHDAFHGPATDYGRVDVGKLPWNALRTSTWLLIILWLTGPLLSFRAVGGPLEYGFAPLQAEGNIEAATDREIDPAGIASGTLDAEGDLPALAEGLPIDVEWPRSHSFMPRSLSCDPTGTKLVVADDFGVYSGQLKAKQEESDAGDRRLRGAAVASDDASAPKLATRFSRAPPCTAFEGDALKDIDVVCTGAAGPAQCRVLVLHANGGRLTECPLSLEDSRDLKAELLPKLLGEMSAQGGVAVTSSTGVPPAGHSHSARGKAGNVEPVMSWKISDDWLDVKKERVQSMAVNNECMSASLSANERNRHAISFERGCLVVGTTSGRLIQLRRHVMRSNMLVPSMSMQHRHQSVGQGSLHVLPGGVVLALRLSVTPATMQAFDMHSGDVIGEWTLPQGISWVALCGGGDHLYVLGRKTHNKQRRHVVLWRFLLPQELNETIRQIVSSDREELDAPSDDVEDEASETAQDRLYEA